MIKWASIEQFRNIVKQVKDNATFHKKPLPTIVFEGTVKLHGTNAGIVSNGQEVWFQSRENIITPEKDNAGFATYMTQKEQDSQLVTKLFEQVKQECNNIGINTENNIIAIYGEWCGGNIQGGANLALAKLPKMFVIFGVRIISAIKETDDGNTVYTEQFLPKENLKNLHINEDRVFNSRQFPTFEVEIDFVNPQAIQNTLIELTLQVEDQCPVGTFFGVEGIGEGIVWTPKDEAHVNSNMLFKTKGEKHSPTKVTKLVEVDVEKLNSVNEFLDMTITENRLNQGLEKLKEQFIPIEDKSTGAFIKWVIGDIIKEEKDRMNASGISEKELGKFAPNRIRQFFLNNLSNL